MTPIRSLTFTPYSGQFTPDNPRGIGPNALRTLDEAIHAASTRACDRIILPRRWGMFEKDIGNSWENDDDKYHYLCPQHSEMGMKYGQLQYRCDTNGITLAHVVGLNAPDGLPLDMAIPAHRACLRRVCERAREQGATEVWVDTGASIGDHDFINVDPSKRPNGEGYGVRPACEIAAECGITLVPEWTGHLFNSDLCPTYWRLRKNKGDAPRERTLPAYGRPTFMCVGWNGGGVEPPDEVAQYAANGHTMVAWNSDARKQALAPAGDVEPTTKETEV